MLRDEIERIAHKEVRATVRDLQKAVSELRRVVAQQKKRIAALESGRNRAAKETSAKGAKPAQAERTTAFEGERIRPTSKMIRNLRTKLGLTQAELAQLLDVSGQSVYQWERKDGPLKLREKTRRALLDVRGIGLREARKRLET
jgi:DNA-binding transcriptional regulator YiaG